MIKCYRCGEMVEKAHPLDPVVHPFYPTVCDECVQDTDEVVDL